MMNHRQISLKGLEKGPVRPSVYSLLLKLVALFFYLLDLPQAGRGAVFVNGSSRRLAVVSLSRNLRPLSSWLQNKQRLLLLATELKKCIKILPHKIPQHHNILQWEKHSSGESSLIWCSMLYIFFNVLPQRSVALGTHLPAALQTFLTSTVRIFFLCCFHKRSFLQTLQRSFCHVFFWFFFLIKIMSRLMSYLARRPLLLQCFYGAAC